MLRQQGKIVYLGSSNLAGWHLAQYQEFARATGGTGLVSERSVYNLAQRSLELEVIPAGRRQGRTLGGPSGHGALIRFISVARPRPSPRLR